MRPSRADLMLAGGLAVAQVGFTYLASRHQPDRQTVDLAGAALLAAGPAALVWRRRFPAAVLAAVFAVTLAYVLTDYGRGPVFLALIVAFVNAVLAGRRAAAWTSLGVGYLAFLSLGPLVGREPAPTLAAILGLAAWLLLLGVGAEFLRTRRERAADAARRREEERRRQASEERLRIARELHDVVAHNLSLINVQAGVALHLLADHPEQAQSALAAIKQASKEGLDEVRAVLDVLRGSDDDAAPRRPAPRLADLDALVERTEEAGVPVRVERTGQVRPLPPPVERAAFRIVQESLTNVVRHARPAAATVRLEYGPDDVVIQVDDDGTSNGDGAAGNGLTGMRERVTALGGRFDAGTRAEGGFRVRAWIPVGREG